VIAFGPAGAPPLPAAAACFDVRGEFDVAAVIAGAQRFCASQGGGAVFAAHVATAASELANNLWMYAARGGQVRLARLDREGACGIELVCEDDGPGIADAELALTEGWSSGGSMGCGLPGVRRLMDEFELHSQLGSGTRVVARKWWRPAP
jgi:serine/threonine-protein kinase RsbT